MTTETRLDRVAFGASGAGRRVWHETTMNRDMWRVVGVVVVCSAAGCSQSIHSQQRADAAQHWSAVRARIKLQLAEQQFNTGHAGDAAEGATEAIALDPTREDAYVLLAQVRLEEGRPADAARVIAAARAAGLDSARLTYTEGVTLEQRGRTEAAYRKYHNARVRDRGNLDYVVAEAELLVALDRPGEALELVDEHIEDAADDATLHALAGRIAVLTGDAATALRRYRSAAALVPESRVLREAYGVLLARTGRWEEAIGALEPLWERADGRPRVGADDAAGTGGGVRPSVQRLLATCYLQVDRPGAAKALLGAYAAAHPDDAEAQVLMAKASIATRDWLGALRCIDTALGQRVVRAGLNVSELRLLRAVAQWQHDDVVGAKDTVYAVLEANPRDIDAYCLLGELLSAGGDDADARTCFERALWLDPGSAWAAAGMRALEAGVSGAG